MIRLFLLALAATLPLAQVSAQSNAISPPMAEAELSEDQSQGEPEVTLSAEAAAAAQAEVLPMINLAPRTKGEIDKGALCHSQFAQRSPLCAQKN